MGSHNGIRVVTDAPTIRNDVAEVGEKFVGAEDDMRTTDVDTGETAIAASRATPLVPAPLPGKSDQEGADRRATCCSTPLHSPIVEPTGGHGRQFACPESHADAGVASVSA